MNRAIRITGLILASLTVSTVAMAQQGGGGNGGGGGGGAGGGSAGGGGDNSIIALRLQDHERSRARLTRPVQPRRGSTDCITHACNEPPPQRRQPAELARLNESCGGGEYLVIRNRQGQVVRYVCEYR
ncbi:hypothetical protein DWF00_03905 [Bosea caraganae]|uniref:Uncharacterized protein n=1 Tax=Bosea caraganae TaxID=2763117 RepID=A0A370L572_9HYPH|nr:hypothetical protein [Bosea caraganae]RDJ24234.1 hypothetical protein DWE98_15135 [Bosea caraganae]RDJ30275.1 hypothetical protein DWF00_03905 [Bosea caraganae]